MKQLKKYTVTCVVTCDQEVEVEAYNIPKAREKAEKMAATLPSGNWNKSSCIKSYKSYISYAPKNVTKNVVKKENYKTEVISL